MGLLDPLPAHVTGDDPILRAGQHFKYSANKSNRIFLAAALPCRLGRADGGGAPSRRPEWTSVDRGECGVGRGPAYTLSKFRGSQPEPAVIPGLVGALSQSPIDI